MNPDLLCEKCFEAELPQCSGDIKVNANLSPSTAYLYTLVSPKGNKYIRAFVSDINGSFTIDVDNLPKGLFIPTKSKFMLTVKSSLNDCEPQDMKFCIDTIETPFKCVLFSIVNTSNEPIINFIGCTC